MQKSRLLLLVLIVGAASIGVRVLMHYKFNDSALLYVGIPFLIAIALIAFTDTVPQPSWRMRYWNITRDSLIVMLASSVILFEGFLCVVMTLPIYFGILLLVFAADSIKRHLSRKPGGKITVHVLPLLILMMSLEGSNESLSFDRHNEVSASAIVSSSIEQIKSNMIKPIILNKNYPWFLKIFPMPYRIDAGTLKAGDVHKIFYRYDRWFFTNTVKGAALLKITEVGENHVKTEVIEDTSYISHYLRLNGTHIQLEAIDAATTRVTLTISFERKLDPVWYFGPLERYGVQKTAEYLIAEVIAPNEHSQ